MKCFCDILGVTRWDEIRNEIIQRRANEVPIEGQLHEALRFLWLEHVMKMNENRVQRQVILSSQTTR